MQASICYTLSILQHLSTAGIYIPPTYNSPPLSWPMRPIISYQAHHPHLPIPMSVLLLLVFVLTCVLLIPFPNPGLGYRAAEKPDPLLSSSPPCYRPVSLADYRVLLRWQWESKVNTLLRLDHQSRFYLFIYFFDTFRFLNSHEISFWIRFKPHLEVQGVAFQSLRSVQIPLCLFF